MKKFLVLFAVLLLAFGIAGCKEDAQKDTADRPSGTSADGDDSGSAGGSAEASAEEASEGGEWSEKFTNLVSKKKSLEFMVEYDYSLDGPSGTDTWTMTQYFGKQRYRMDTEVNGQEGRFYMIDNQITSCHEQNGDWMCMQLPQGEEDEMNDPTETFTEIEENPGDVDTTYKGTRRIAGTTAHCYGVDWSAYGTDGGMEVCYSKEGVPLYMKSESAGTTVELEAKRYKTGVSNSDFEFPAEPMDMGGMMAQYGAYQ